MTLQARRLLGTLGTLVGMLASTAGAQTTYPNVKLTGRLQEQFYYFDNEPYAATVGAKDNFFTRRARIEARGQISENVVVYIQPSFEGGRNLSGVTTACTSTPVPVGGGTPTITCRTTGRSGLRLRDAWVDVRFSPEASKGALYLRAGQEKRPYSRYELTSSNNLVSIERGAGQGLVPRASNDLFAANGFVSHDVGASVRYEYKLDDARPGHAEGRRLQRTRRKFERCEQQEELRRPGHRGGVFQARYRRVLVRPRRHRHRRVHSRLRLYQLRLGCGCAVGEAGDEGLYVLGEYLDGNDATAAKNKIRGIQGLAAYNYRFTSPTSWLYAIEPAFRIDISDPNTSVDNDRSTLITAVLGIYMSSKAQLRVAYERQSFQGDVTPAISGVRSALTVNF